MARALAAINDVKLLERKADAACQLLNTGAQLAIFEWSQLVEEGLDHARVDGDEEELEDQTIALY